MLAKMLARQIYWMSLRCSRSCKDDGIDTHDKPDPDQFLLSGPSVVLALDFHNKRPGGFRVEHLALTAMRHTATTCNSPRVDIATT